MTQNTQTTPERKTLDLNGLQERATRHRDAFIGALIRQGLIRLTTALKNLVVPPVMPDGA